MPWDKAKIFVIKNLDLAFNLIEKEISINFLVNLSLEARVVTLNNPVRLERLLKAGITYDQILALSAENQKKLILYSESLVSEVAQDKSVIALSTLAEKGPFKNEERYGDFVRNVKQVCGQYIFMAGWEEQPEVLEVKEQWLKKIEQGELTLPYFDEQNIHWNDPSKNWSDGLEKFRKLDIPLITVMTKKVSPLMNCPAWNPVKHRNFILDSVLGHAGKIIDCYAHEIRFNNSTGTFPINVSQMDFNQFEY